MKVPLTYQSNIGYLIGLVLMTCLSLGTSAEEKKVTTAVKYSPTSNVNNYIPPHTINQILYQIDSYYVDETDKNDLILAAIENIFKQLDPHSKFLSESQLTNLMEITNGKYNGLGIEVEKRGDYVVILNTIDNSPAQIAGLLKGDIIVGVNGKDVSDADVNDIAALIKKHQDKSISLQISRDSYPTPLSFDVEQAELEVDSVTSSMLPGGIGYLKLYSFQTQTHLDVLHHVQILKDQSEGNLEGLIIDVRDNPGGVLESAIKVADLFLNKGKIVSTEGRFNEANQVFFARRGDLLKGKKIVTLINQGSASAAEILAGALRDNKRAQLLGEQSFGKGSVQSLIPINQGRAAIKLTTALYFTPSGQSIDGIGITPDFKISQHVVAENVEEIIIDKDSKLLPNGQMLAANDIQLLEAQKLLKK